MSTEFSTQGVKGEQQFFSVEDYPSSYGEDLTDLLEYTNKMFRGLKSCYCLLYLS
jgi:hypothetical protein